ncbi:hypothetical protein CLV58_1367 [Spirosoma oryzae]|uniref:Uncharacterized protein n=1 Tax=Spirosoma oryzae TaxID=1469603 RepID=A0A2T0RXL2_9BACT|nr:hypothetical protein [Spirosoma oryzae]PRY25872.1 hypothetical protein CLV58_1367 [Spirosoma oryzae]
MTDRLGFDIDALSDELLADLLETFAIGRSWTDLVHSQAIAAEVIDQQLTVQFHAFIQAQIGL